MYTKEKIKQYSKINWYPINSLQRGEFSNEIQKTFLELYDSRTLGELFKETEEIFQVKRIGERPYEYPDNTHISITYEMNLNRIVV